MSLITSVFQLLLEHLEAISPDRNDLLHELLQDLGDVPDVEALLGTVKQTFYLYKSRVNRRYRLAVL